MSKSFCKAVCIKALNRKMFAVRQNHRYGRMNSHVHTQTGMALRQRSRGARSRHFDACGPKQQGFSPPSRLSRRQQVICAANDADVVRPHQRSGGDRVFASGKYGKVGSRGVWGRAPYRKRCPAASQPLRQGASVATCPCRSMHRKFRKRGASVRVCTNYWRVRVRYCCSKGF